MRSIIVVVLVVLCQNSLAKHSLYRAAGASMDPWTARAFYPEASEAQASHKAAARPQYANRVLYTSNANNDDQEVFESEDAADDQDSYSRFEQLQSQNQQNQYEESQYEEENQDEQTQYGPFAQGRYAVGQFEKSQYEKSQFEQGQFEQGQFEQIESEPSPQLDSVEANSAEPSANAADKTDCNCNKLKAKAKITYGPETVVRGKPQTYIQHQPKIIVRQPPTHVRIEHPPTIIQPSAVVVRRHGKIIRRPVIYQHLPRDVQVRPVYVQLVKPIEKKIFLEKNQPPCHKLAQSQAQPEDANEQLEAYPSESISSSFNEKESLKAQVSIKEGQQFTK